MNALANAITNNASTILTTAGLGAMAASTALAVKATPKAMYKIDVLKLKKAESESVEIAQDDEGNDLTPDVKLTLMDYIKVCWVDYMPAAITMGVGVACILIARRIDAAKIVALASAAKYAQDKLEEHQKALAKLEPADREKVEEAISKTLVEQAGDLPPWATEEVVDPDTGVLVPVQDADWGGDMLCLDSLSGQYFRSNPDKIEKAVTAFRTSILDSNSAVFGAAFGTVTDFYEYLGLQSSSLFDALGWTQGHPLSVYFSSTLTENSNRPILVLKYKHQPRILDTDIDLK